MKWCLWDWTVANAHLGGVEYKDNCAIAFIYARVDLYIIRLNCNISAKNTHILTRSHALFLYDDADNRHKITASSSRHALFPDGDDNCHHHHHHRQ